MRFLDNVDFKLYASNGGVNALGTKRHLSTLHFVAESSRCCWM